MKLTSKKYTLFKVALFLLEVLYLLVFTLLLFVFLNSKIAPPKVEEIKLSERQTVGINHYRIGENWLKKNEFGIWEMYLEGPAYERGLIYGRLSKEINQEQEDIFINQIQKLIPNQFLQQFLRIFIGFFNHNLPNYIPLEYQKEIYGISQSFSKKNNFIGPKYTRILNYHAAHDIGHALNDYSLVGCTSFALKDSKTVDGGLLIGRNFDFYVGEEFAKNKLLLFMQPDSGYGFASYSWPGFMGVVSGLNEKGISVSINASKSALPTSAKTPISILAREILQYASTTNEAIAIAKKREVFVSETIMIGSKTDHKTILIEKAPNKMGVYAIDSDEIVCSNHYQSNAFINDSINILNIKTSDSKYRFNRMKALLDNQLQVSVNEAASILRDQSFSETKPIGLGNPKAINSLNAYHSVIIEPDSLLFYASTNDYQLGEFIAYKLDQVLETKKARIVDTIPVDSFIYSATYKQYKQYRKIKQKITGFLSFNEALALSEEDVYSFISTNPELYTTYEILARYYIKKENLDKANKYLDIALSKELPSLQIKKELKQLRNS